MLKLHNQGWWSGGAGCTLLIVGLKDERRKKIRFRNLFLSYLVMGEKPGGERKTHKMAKNSYNAYYKIILKLDVVTHVFNPST